MSAEWNKEQRAGHEPDAGAWSRRERGPDRLVVAAYLNGAHGFLVDTTDGREVGVVDDVILDLTGTVTELDVRGGWFGRRRNVISASDVVDIFPDLRRLVVAASAVREE